MKGKFTLMLMISLWFVSGVLAQTYELNEVKQIPSVDERNMKMVAFCIWDIYKEVLKKPEAFSTEKAVNTTVSTFYDTDFQGQHDRLYAVKGKPYACTNHDQLMINDRLMFNLRFDADGKIIVPDTIYFISYRLEPKDKRMVIAMPVSFGLKLTDSMQASLAKISLEHVAKTRVDSIKGELMPVEIKVPFVLSRQETAKRLNGTIFIDNNKVDLTLEGSSPSHELLKGVFNSQMPVLEYYLLKYKSGRFALSINQRDIVFQIDLNIKRDKVWKSEQTKSFSFSEYEVSGFEGTGEKSKQFLSVQKYFQKKLQEFEK